MEKIKVLFVIHDLSVGGAEKVLVNLVNNMNYTKFDITLMSIFDEGVNKQFLRPEIKYIACFKKAIRGNSHYMKLFSPQFLHKMLIKDTYDIEVAYLEGPSARIVSGCPDLKTKLISWIHIEQKSKKNSARAFRSYKESVKCYQCFERIICVSDDVRKDFLKLYSLNNPIEVLFNTNESDKIRILAKEPVNLMQDDAKTYRLIGVGKIVANKGFDRLARIHKKLLNEGYLVHTYVLGEGTEREKIEQFIKENHLEDSFTFGGYQVNPYKYVSKCDIFVCTSFAEGFSTAATEAMIVGIPVVTTPVAGMNELLGDNNEYGIITEQNEESLFENIKKLLDDPELLKEYKQRALLRGKEFSKEKTVKAVENMLFTVKKNDLD